MKMTKIEQVLDKDFEETGREKVAMCVPAYKDLPVIFVEHLIEQLNENAKYYDLATVIKDVIPIDVARNRCIQAAKIKKADYIWFMDSDNISPPGALKKLMKGMKEYNADMITGMYFEKAKPYFPVIRSYSPDYGFRKIDNPHIGGVIEIGGSGMGCALIKVGVFDVLKYPWFKFEYEDVMGKETIISEDLYFCRSMFKSGLSMYCDTEVIAPHLGGIVDRHEFWSFERLRENLKNDREEFIADVMRYTDQSYADVQNKLYAGHILIANEWNDKNPQTLEEVESFYVNTENYIYDLGLWHFTSRRMYDLDVVNYSIEKYKPKTVLDFGCGIGQNGYMLAKEGFDVTIADLNGVTFDFAICRFDKHRVPSRVWHVDNNTTPPHDKYDLILCFDVLEHLSDEEFKKVVEKLIELKHEDTKVLLSTNFGKSEFHPMHFEREEWKQELIDRLVGKDD